MPDRIEGGKEDRMIFLKDQRMGGRFVFFVLLPCLLLSSFFSLGFDSDGLPRLDRSKLTWSEIDLTAKKLFLTAQSRLVISNSNVEKSNDSSSNGAVCGLGRHECPLLMQLESDLLGRHSQTRTWFSETTGMGLRSLRLETGKRNRFKDYIFASNGVHVTRRNPFEGEEKRPVDRWSEVSEEFLPYPEPEKLGCRLTDPAVLLYAVSVGRLSRSGDALDLYVLSKGRFFRVSLVHGGRCDVAVDHVQIRAGSEKKMSGMRTAHRILVKPNPWTGKQEDKAFSLLGLQGELEIFVDEASRVPLLVTGEIKIIGNVEIRLRRVVLADR